MAFERLHHQRIAALLESLDGDVLRQHECWFGGGTAIALRYGEYRESVDVDFLVSDETHYRRLRTLVDSVAGLRALQPAGAQALEHRPVRADGHGIRTAVRVDGVDIKFEIVREARIAFASPRRTDRVSRISTLTPLDLVASKLLANTDRGRDVGVFNRDVIDLAMMRPSLALLREGLHKASAARGYGAAVEKSLAGVIAYMAERMDWLDRCMTAMAMQEPRAVVWQRIRSLRRVLT